LLVSLRCCCASRLSSSLSSLIPSTSTLCVPAFRSLPFGLFVIYARYLFYPNWRLIYRGSEGRTGNSITWFTSREGFFPFVCVRVDGGFSTYII
jgi:hypothetical protein